jgi:outer membrane scaffolding protein for murein synthesis (MipA/OmpV family)
MTSTRRRISAVLAALLAADVVSAASVLDYLRAYDLNDYALGVSVSISENPYAGGNDSVVAYPYLTSFRDASFTDDWFLISDGDLGLRWVDDSGWVLGVVGRVQTLGLGDSASDVVSGLDDRNWSVEIAPMVGFRRWPVHVNLKSYFEVLGRHGGHQTELALRFPREYEWGYLVPSVAGIYRSAEYADYYFGVSAAEARPVRPAYTVGATTGAEVKLRWGVELSRQWLLSGSFGLEFLGDEISNSPIVDNEKIWSANIGLAYNADLFQPRESRRGGKRQARLELRLAGFSVSADGKVVHDNVNGEPGDEIDLEDLLGIDDSENVVQFEAIYRFNDFHRFELSYHRMSRTGTTQLERDINFGDKTFSSGSELVSRFDSELLRLGYGYSLINDEQKELGVMAGMHLTDRVTEIVALPSGEQERTDVSTPLPVIGAFGSVETGRRSSLGAELQLFGLQFDRLEGTMLFASLEWQWRIGDRLSVGIGYNAYYTRLRSREEDGRGRLETWHRGPTLSLAAGF